MEQGSGVGSKPSSGDMVPPEVDASTSQLVPAAPEAALPQGEKAAPKEERVPAATETQDGVKDDPGQKTVGEAGGGKTETAPAAPEAQGGEKTEEVASTSPEEKVPDATKDQGRGKDKVEPGKDKAPAAEEPKEEKAAPMEGKAPAAPKAQDGRKDEPGEEKAAAAGKPEEGKAVPAGEKALDAAKAQDRGKDEPRKEQTSSGLEAEGNEKTKPTEEKAPPAAEAEGGKVKPAEEKALAGAQAQAGGKEEPAKEKPLTAAKEEVPAAAKAQDGRKKTGKAEKPPADKKPAKEKIPAAAKAQNGEKKAEKVEKASAAKKAQGGGKEEPAKEKGTASAKEKVPDAAKAQDGGKAAARTEKPPADNKPVKDKAPAAVKAQDGENKVVKAEKGPDAKKAEEGGKEEPAKKSSAEPSSKAQDGEKAAEKTPAAKEPQDGGKEQPAKEKAAAPAKENVPVAAKVQGGGKQAPKVEKPRASSKAEDGGKEEPAKEKAPDAVKAEDGEKKAAKVEPSLPAAEAEGGGKEPAEAVAAVKAQGEGEKAVKMEETKKQQPRGPEPPRPALLQSLSCPATCHREEQPLAEVMEMIPEETTTVEPREGPAKPGPAPQALGDLQPPEPPSTLQDRTLPSATGQPGPGVQPSSREAQPPPSPYLTPDFGKEDPFEILDDVPPPPAPFAHRIVTLRSASVSSQFNLDSKDILGGGKFGEVHTCTEKQTGLKLAAKVIRKQGTKDKEMVLLEIDVMNQLNHRNLIQLYDAIETPREIILFMEFVEGGELFERIIDDDYQLTEVDCMVFVRQICEGIRFMHHMHVLHLDLKPENILCVAATGHMVKIIDFGLARRYNPQEKLKVNFGTPEFLSPEVVNYEQVSYSTDMWSMGVITYMLLSGLSPFLGDNDTETLNNVLAANWYFDEETFESVSDEAKDFVSNLIIKEKSGRMSAAQCLEHPWLNNLAEKAKRCNRRLKSQVLLRKYVMRRRWKKNFIGVCAANRFKKITSSGSLTALGV